MYSAGVTVYVEQYSRQHTGLQVGLGLEPRRVNACKAAGSRLLALALRVRPLLTPSITVSETQQQAARAFLVCLTPNC